MASAALSVLGNLGNGLRGFVVGQSDEDYENKIRKLKPEFHVPGVKVAVKMSYRELIHGMVGGCDIFPNRDSALQDLCPT